MRYLFLFFWLELVCLFAFGCSAPKERRGDWMEHLNYRQFHFQAPSSHWDRHNYYTIEELKEMWGQRYEEAIKDIPAAAKRVQDRGKQWIGD